jgi:hypothetical protein
MLLERGAVGALLLLLLLLLLQQLPMVLVHL